MDARDPLVEQFDRLVRQQDELAAQVTALRTQVAELAARDAANDDTNRNYATAPIAAHPTPGPAPARPGQQRPPATPGPLPPPALGPLPPPALGPLPPAAPGLPPAIDASHFDTPTRSRRGLPRLPSAAGHHPPPQHLAAPTMATPQAGPRSAHPPADSGFLPDRAGPHRGDDHGGLISKLFAFVGAGVLLLGVGFLLVLVAQAGWFGPVPQVISVGILAAVLLGLAVWLRRRSPAGSTALAGVAFAAAYLDMAAITALHEWIPRVLGLAIAGAIAVAGLALARLWGSGAVATIVSLGVLILVPMISPNNTTALGFGIAFAIVSVAVTWGLGWLGPQLARLLPLAGYALVAAVAVDRGDPDFRLLTGATVVMILLGLAESLSARTVPPRAPRVGPTTGRRPGAPAGPNPVGVVAGVLLPLLALPALIIGLRWGADTGAVLLTVLGAAVIAASVPALLPDWSRGAAALTGGVLLPLGLGLWLPNAWSLTPMLLTSLLLLGLAWTMRTTVHVIAGLLHAAVMVGVTVVGTPQVFLNDELAADGFPGFVVRAALACLVVIFARLLVRRVPMRPSQPAEYGRRGVLDAVCAVIVVVLGSPMVISIGSRLAEQAGALPTGFRVAHAVVTVGWFGLAGHALLSGLRPSATATTRRAFGLWLAAAALLKLLLWDLSVLSGLVRVVVAMVTGLLLIGLGIWYARAIERAGAVSAPMARRPPPPPPSGPPGRR